jgi:hypothetical protein
VQTVLPLQQSPLAVERRTIHYGKVKASWLAGQRNPNRFSGWLGFGPNCRTVLPFQLSHGRRMHSYTSSKPVSRELTPAGTSAHSRLLVQVIKHLAGTVCTPDPYTWASYRYRSCFPPVDPCFLSQLASTRAAFRAPPLGDGLAARIAAHASKSSIFTGSSRTRTPVAWCTASVMAAAIPASPISPMPRAPIWLISLSG